MTHTQRQAVIANWSEARFRDLRSELRATILDYHARTQGRPVPDGMPVSVWPLADARDLVLCLMTCWLRRVGDPYFFVRGWSRTVLIAFIDRDESKVRVEWLMRPEFAVPEPSVN